MWIPTGSTLLNLSCSQDPYKAFLAGRVHRITGESSSVKTGLAASAFFLGALLLDRQEIPFKFIFDDTEQTFDVEYYYKAYPFLENYVDSNIFVYTGEKASKTLEDFTERFNDFCDECHTDGKVGFYFLDSLDALPPREEVKRFEKEGVSLSVNAATKAILLSQFFMDISSKMAKSNVGLVLVSQVRDQMSIGFGKAPQGGRRVSGGNAPVFYSSLIIYLKNRKTEEVAVGDSKKGQYTGMNVKVADYLDIEFKIVKNKIGRPYLSGFFTFILSTGAVDDARDITEFLKQNGYFNISGSWVTYKDKKFRTTELYDIVRNDIKTFRSITADLFNKSLEQTSCLTNIQDLW